MPDPVHAPIAGRYAVREVLAVGGMSTVHVAQDLQLGRDVALKVFRTTGDPLDADRLRREGALLARLAHPHLVRAFDAGADPDGSNAWLALELISGPNLAVALHGAGPMPAATVRRLLEQVADALAYIHGLGIVHRDVKPSNVLLTADPAADPGWAAKLADFGIATELTAGRVLAGDAPVGTAPYFSPEQTLGQPVTTASDIYSLGLVVLEALTGERAFPGGAIESATARLFRQPALPAWLDHGWRALLETMTARDPRSRPSAAQIRAASRSLSGGLQARPAAAGGRYDADVHTEPATVLAPALLAAAEPVPVPVVAAPPAARRRRYLRPGFADRFSRRALVASSAGVLVLCVAAGGTTLVAAAPAKPLIPLEQGLPTAPPVVADLSSPVPSPVPEAAATPRPPQTPALIARPTTIAKPDTTTEEPAPARSRNEGASKAVSKQVVATAKHAAFKRTAAGETVVRQAKLFRKADARQAGSKQSGPKQAGGKHAKPGPAKSGQGGKGR